MASSPLFLNLAMVEGSTSSPRASWQQCSTARRAGRLPAVVVADSHSLQQQEQTLMSVCNSTPIRTAAPGTVP